MDGWSRGPTCPVDWKELVDYPDDAPPLEPEVRTLWRFQGSMCARRDIGKICSTTESTVGSSRKGAFNDVHLYTDLH